MGDPTSLLPDPPESGGPEISVVMTTFNSERFIAGSVGSVLRQDHPSFELVVQDDGSTDGTLAHLARIDDPRLRVVGTERIGRAAALNAAVRASRGQLIAINDVDDISLPRRLAVTQKGLAGSPDAVLVGTRVRSTHRFAAGPPALTTESNRQPDAVREVSKAELYRRNPFVHSAVMFRRSAWSTIGGYDESLPMCVDYDLFLRMAALGGLLMLTDVTVEHFIHPDSYFKRRPPGEYLEVLRKIRCRARSRLGIPLWARAFDVVPYLQAARARLLRP